MGDIGYGLAAIVGGIAVSFGLYWALDKLVGLFPEKIQNKIRALGFVTPAAVLLVLILLFPLLDTFWLSFQSKDATEFVGFKNYVKLFTDPGFMQVLLNNFLWVAIVPAVTVGIGLLVATLSNNVGPTREKIFKSLIFMPMAISFVSAATIWRFMYVYVPPGRSEIGLLNSILHSFGIAPQPWLTLEGINSFLLMIIIIWLQAGFAMVLLSAAIKAVPEETIEAARIDGAGTTQVFFSIIVPQIRGTIMSVFITVLILVMKIFDIVLAMTGGNFKTSVLGFEFYKYYFLDGNTGGASAIVTILTILVAPLMWMQIRTVRHQESLR